jgi:hypothetical protein
MSISIKRPIDGVIQVFQELYPDKRCLVIYTDFYIPNLEDDTDDSPYLGWCQSWRENDDQPSWRVLISGLASINDSVGILIHELTHIVGGYEHGDDFKDAMKPILAGYLVWAEKNLGEFAPKFKLDDICQGTWNRCK